MTQRALQGEPLTLRYVPLEEAALWDENPKLHDESGRADSIRVYPSGKHKYLYALDRAMLDQIRPLHHPYPK